MQQIYLDNASATKVNPQVLKVMQPYFASANPSSIHAAGIEAKEAIETARQKVAKYLYCNPQEIIFTSGGTESINLALKGVAFAKGKGHIITSKIEHPAVLETCKFLETQGFKVTYLNVDKYGFVNLEQLKKSIKKSTILISIMYANNEIGTIQNVKAIGQIARKNKILFHTDACQAGNLTLNTKKLDIDLLTLNGAKIYGPKGVGILYKRSNIKLQPLLHGGGQEFGLRSGTQNVPAIVGFGKALELAQQNEGAQNKKLTLLRDYFIKKVLTQIPQSTLLGHATKRLPNNLNIAFKGVDAQDVVKYLSQKGIYVSAGSACSSNKLEESHVLRAIDAKDALGSVRFSLAKTTTKKELDYVVKKLKEIVQSLRLIS